MATPDARDSRSASIRRSTRRSLIQSETVCRDTPHILATAAGPPASLTAAATRLGLLISAFLTVARCSLFAREHAVGRVQMQESDDQEKRQLRTTCIADLPQ